MFGLAKKKTATEDLQPEKSDFIVVGHLECDTPYTKYVRAVTAAEAEGVFDRWIRAEMRDTQPGERIIFDSVTEIPGPPVAIFTDEGLVKNPEPIE